MSGIVAAAKYLGPKLLWILEKAGEQVNSAPGFIAISEAYSSIKDRLTGHTEDDIKKEQEAVYENQRQQQKNDWELQEKKAQEQQELQNQKYKAELEAEAKKQEEAVRKEQDTQMYRTLYSTL